ncbi:hypothetical protein BJ165DRAFT_106099 [Panaeolus papilionaceus]|nr:hypothetical protein BJ165DRAFT_106099 [Panaeolus papilionaceus]
MPFGFFKSRKSKEQKHEPSLLRSGSQTSGKLRKSNTLTRHPPQPSIAEEGYAPPRPIRLMDEPMLHRPDSGVPFEIDPTQHPPPQLFSPELPGLQHDAGRYPAPYARKRAPELESLYTGQRSVLTDADPVVSKYISGVPANARTPISTVPSRAWSPIPSVHREPSTLTRHQIDEEDDEWGETPDRSYMQRAASNNSEVLPVQPRFANYADSVHHARLTQAKKNQPLPPGSIYAPSMQRSARAPSTAAPFMGAAMSQRSYRAPSERAPSITGSMMRAPSHQGPSRPAHSERFAPSTAGSARRPPSNWSGHPPQAMPHERLPPIIYEADSDDRSSREPPEVYHYIVPRGVNFVFEDEAGNDIVSINKRGLVQPSRNYALKNIPIIVHDEFGKQLYQ